MSEHTSTEPSLSSVSDEALIGRVADEFLNRVQHGERPDVEEYARQHPAIADVLRDLLPPLLLMPGVEDHSASARGGYEEQAEVLAKPLGDFKLVREIGRGGMGVVYEARQLSLGRRVALKVLPFASMLDQRQLARFRNEAQAAAHLHHTNIVPVFNVGCDRGVHYYAMQFIDGQPLSAVIRELRRVEGLSEAERQMPDVPAATLSRPAWNAEQLNRGAGGVDGEDGPASTSLGAADLAADSAGWSVSDAAPGLASAASSRSSSSYYRNVAELGVQAAEALDHAHEQGVVHRDIKPSNLLLDGDGRLWITDFGLASFQKSDATLTLPGDVLGTLRYMSPEQALGKPGMVDHRTDIYSLGVSLYELLALRSAFTGSDRQALLNQIALQEPTTLRKLNPSIPSDLATIIGKAIAKEPIERYATAKELADDLRRYLEHKPIRARRPSLLQVASKWAVRHRGYVAGAMLALVLAVIGLSIGLVLLAEERSQTRVALEDASAEARRASSLAATLEKMLGSDPARLDYPVAVAAQSNRPKVGASDAASMSWAVEAEFVPDRRTNNEDLGDEIAAADGTLALGVWLEDIRTADMTLLRDAGAVYIYELEPDPSQRPGAGERWQLVQKLIAPDPGANAYFGRHVVTDGKQLIVGAHFADTVAARAGAVYVFARRGDRWEFSQKLVAPDPSEDMRYGFQVDVDNGVLAVGSFYADGPVTKCGAVYLYEQDGSGWRFVQKLSPSDLRPPDQFGFSLDLAKNRLVVGAVHAEIDSAQRRGSAYVFKREEERWAQEAKLLASDGEADDRFGFDVAIDGDTIVVGADCDKTATLGPYPGAAYVFVADDRGKWIQDAKLQAEDRASRDNFGRTVAICGDVVVVGCHGTVSVNEGRAGAAYVFTRSQGPWQQSAKLCPSDPFWERRMGGGLALMEDRIVLGPRENIRRVEHGISARETVYCFSRVGETWLESSEIRIPHPPEGGHAGASVALTAGVAVMGIPGSPFEDGCPGSVEVHAKLLDDTDPVHKGGWVLRTSLTPPDGAPHDQFGRSVATDGRVLVVGSPYADHAGVKDCGAAYVYELRGALWVMVAKLVAPDAALGDRFGVSVALDGDTIAVGADRVDVSTGRGTVPDVGAVYLFDRHKGRWSFSLRIDPAKAPESDAYFGHCVAISSDQLIIGAPRDDTDRLNGGAVYAYARSGRVWRPRGRLTPTTEAAFEYGTSLAIDADTVVVGSRYDGHETAGSGLAYVFEHTVEGWVERDVLSAPDASPSDFFGARVDVRGDLIVVGASMKDDDQPQEGAAYAYRRRADRWVFDGRITHVDLNPYDRAGHAVATDGSSVMVGAPFHDHAGKDCGAAAIFVPRGK